MTVSDLSPGFQSHNIFEIKYRKNDKNLKIQGYYFTLLGNYT